MSVTRTPFSYSAKPLGAAGKQFPAPLPRKPVSLEFMGGCTVLSIKASNSVLSEKALQAFRYAFLRNQKIGIGSLPSNESPSRSELDKANASYEIANNLVDWFDQFYVEEDDAPDLESNVENEHRSSDLKKEENLFLRCDVKNENSISNSESKDLKLDWASELFPLEPDLKFDFTNEFELFPLGPDLKDVPDLKGASIPLDSVVKATTCEAMDFFGRYDNACEMQWNSKIDDLTCNGFDVDISFGTGDGTVPSPLMNDSEHLDDNLISPLSSPGSPVSPYSPSTVFL